ncbi:MAG: PilZ domain-containing protein [Acidiferrobacterales bacterium]
MPRERRLGPRKLLALEVMLDHSRHGMQRYQTRDVSLEGVYIDADGLTLRKNSVVELVLKIPANGKTKHYRIKAKLATVRRQGARFIFRNLDEKAYTALVDLLYPNEQ